MKTWFERIKTFYDRRLWTIDQVRTAVLTNTITEDEYYQITGEVYQGG